MASRCPEGGKVARLVRHFLNIYQHLPQLGLGDHLIAVCKALFSNPLSPVKAAFGVAWRIGR
jgi:hypothetical protein